MKVVHVNWRDRLNEHISWSFWPGIHLSSSVMFRKSNLNELANLSYSAVCEETLSEKMKEITVIRNSIMEQLPKKDGLIRTNPDKPHRKHPLQHRPRSAQLKKRNWWPSMKAIARMLTGIPKVTEKISHPKPVMQLVANETQPSATKPTTASNQKPIMRIYLIQGIAAFLFFAKF